MEDVYCVQYTSFMLFSPQNAELFSIKTLETKGFFQFAIIIKDLVPIHSNTYAMGLLPLYIFLLLQCGDRF